MVTSKLISGLGNQLFQYAIGRQLSLDRNTGLKLDTSFFGSQNLRSYKLDYFNVKASVATDEEIADCLDIYSSKSLYAKIYRRIEAKQPKYKRHLFREEQWWVYEPELFKVPTDVYIDGYWQHYKYFMNLNPQVLDEITLKNKPSAEVEQVINEVSYNSSVAVHVRRGDYITDPEAYNFMGVMPISYYTEAIRLMRAKVVNPRFYFFSDDLDWVRENLLTAEDMHVVDIKDGRDYIDLDIMSKCAHNIIANSSFSWWGAFLNKNPSKIVIAPAQWVVPPDVNARIELVFPSWIKI